MKILSKDFSSSISSIKDNLKKFKIDIYIDDRLKIDNSSLNLTIEGAHLGLLNALRQIAYKHDYVYYMDCEMPNITECESINKTELINRLNSVIISNDDEDNIFKYVDSKAGFINKKVTETTVYIKTKDIVTDVIITDSDINLCLMPKYYKGVFNISEICIKKGYTMDDCRFCNVTDFVVAPILEQNEKYDYNNVYSRYKIKITSSGYMHVDKVFSRLINLLYIKLHQPINFSHYNKMYLLQTGVYLENILLDYCDGIICKLVKTSLHIYNVNKEQVESAIEDAKNDIYTLLSIYLNIDNNLAKKNLKNNIYSKQWS